MAVAEFLEDIVSHLPALHLLQHLGFQYLTPTEALASRGGKRGRVVLDTILLDQLRKLNQITFKGEKHDFTEANLRAAVGREGQERRTSGRTGDAGQGRHHHDHHRQVRVGGERPQAAGRRQQHLRAGR